MNSTATHPDVVAAVTRRLEAAGVPSAAVDARWLVDHVIEVAGEPTGCGAALLDGLVARRLAREPLQLIIGSWPFRTVELQLRAGVFIPRPETEVVAGLAIDAVRGFETPTIVEPCTGTGAIAASIYAEVAGATIIATDRDPAAVELARDNLGRVARGEAGVPSAAGAHASVLIGDLLDPVDTSLRGNLDVLVSNPPYLPAADAAMWEPEVAEHDPHAALVGGPDGHEEVDALLGLAVRWLKPGGTVVIEIDERRGADAMSVAEAVGLTHPQIVQDLTGTDRAIVAQAR